MLQMRYLSDPILRKKALPVTEVTPEICSLAAEMEQMMREKDGVGLAAPQVGHSIRLFVMAHFDPEGENEVGPVRVCINPVLLDPHPATEIMKEGCLSIPGVRGPVERPIEITLQATDLSGHLFTIRLQGLMARIAMHENDHLNGVLFIDRMTPKDRKLIERQIQEIQRRQKTLFKK